MNRRNFTTTCILCLASPLIAPVLNGCKPVHYTTGTMETDGLTVSASEFRYRKKEKEMVREYIIVRNDSLRFPIYLYRFSDARYSALLMKCTHQGNELSASGDHLACPAHGSEFNNLGVMVQGPAMENLRSFPVKISGEQIFIDLRS